MIKTEYLEELLQQLHLDEAISLEDIPKVDLYVDQIVQLFESKFEHATRHSDDKVLTKTMINNYAKGKLLPPIKGKKYTKEQIMIISFIYHFKSVLSLQDCKKLLELLPSHENNEELHAVYNSFLHIYDNNQKEFTSKLSSRLEEVKKEASISSIDHIDNVENFLLISSLLNSSLHYKRLAEKLLDEMTK